MNGTVYVLHFDPPYQHATHYVGWTAGVSAQARLAAHTSPLVMAAKAAGCEITIAHTQPGNRHLERKIKNQKNSKRFCPICKQVEAELNNFAPLVAA